MELRRIADVLDKQPNTEIFKPELSFWHGYAGTKEQFLSLARIFPRPFQKRDGLAGQHYILTHESAALNVEARIDRSKVCRLVKPAQEAEYECEPLLTQDEEMLLEPKEAA